MDKELLINEIKKYKGNTSFLDLCIELKNEKQKKKILINNKYGLLGNLLNKYINELDKEILKEICIKDI